MSLRFLLCFSGVLLLVQSNVFSQFQYISPVPGSKFHNPETNIILKNGSLIDEASLSAAGLFSINGSSSGRHEAAVILSDDGKTVVLEPTTPFAEGETVSVTVSDGMKTVNGKSIEGTSFSFYMRDVRTPEIQQRLDDAQLHVFEEEFGKDAGKGNSSTRDIEDWSGGIPPYDIWVNSNPTDGDVFFNNFNFAGFPTGHYCIITNDGDSLYGKYDQAKGINFYLNHNGYMTLYNQPLFQYEVLDSNYASISKLRCKNGYEADVHECQMYPNGHCFLVAYDPQPFDMTIYDPSYNPNATVIGFILQEFDAAHHVIFQWRSWDHFDILDATHTPFTASEIDYVHGNSVDLDADNNIIISCRHMDEITKIDHNTGDIIWRFGGKNNQFNVTNDPILFSYQHDVRRIANGNITVFDNGNWHLPPISSAKEYHLDEVNMTATLAWSYKSTHFGNSVAMGSVQRLDNGNTFICWGLAYAPSFPTITEVDPNGNIVWEMRLKQEFNDGMYRAHRFEWSPCARPTLTTLKSSNITQTSAKLKWTAATNAASYEVQYKKQGGGAWTTVTTSALNKVINNLTPGTKYNWRMRSSCNLDGQTYSAYTPKMNFTTLPLKIEAEEKAISMTVFPNPAHDIIHISTMQEQNPDVVIRVVNLLGEEVYASETVLSNTEGLDLPVTGWEPGLYFVTLYADNEVLQQPVVIQ